MDFDQVDMRYIFEIAMIKKELDPQLCFNDLEQITKVYFLNLILNDFFFLFFRKMSIIFVYKEHSGAMFKYGNSTRFGKHSTSYY